MRTEDLHISLSSAALAFVMLAAEASLAAPSLWQTNSEGDDVHVFRLQDFQLIGRLEVGRQPHGIAAPSDGSVVYVSIEANGRDHGELLWINPRTLVVEHRLDVGPEPHAIAATPDGKWVYVPCRDGDYWVVDANTRKVVKRIRTGGRPHNTQASADGRFMYLSPMGRPFGVTVVDVRAEHEIVGFIPFSESVRPAALSPDGSLLFHHVDGLNGFQVADTHERKLIATVVHSSSLGALIPLKRLGYLTLQGFKRCHGISVRPDQQEVWSTCADHLTVHGAERPFAERATVKLPGKGYWLTFSPDGRYGFIALSELDSVVVMDAVTKQIVSSLSTGKSPKRNLVLER